MKDPLDSHLAAYTGESIYDFDNEILLTWYPGRVIANSADAESILELGLGHGFATNVFASRFKRHVVIDGSPAVIENFRRRFPQCAAEIVEAYFEDFRTDDTFDLIVMGFVLEHVDDPVRILARYGGFLSPRGKMFVAVPNGEVLNRRLGHLAGMLQNMDALSENDLLLGHKRYYTVATLTTDLESAGYRVERMEGIYLKPFTTRQIMSLELDPKIFQALCEVGVDYPELSCGILAQTAPR